MQEMLLRLLHQVSHDSNLEVLVCSFYSFHEMLQSKKIAELRIKDLKVNMDSLAAELQKEKLVSNSGLTMAKSACRESLTIKRVIRSLGCKVYFLWGEI